MSLEEDGGDIPFITEVDEFSASRHHSLGRSLQPSPCHSRSPSFRDDRSLLEVKNRSSSLGNLRSNSVGSLASYSYHRRASSRRSRRSQHVGVSRRESRRHSVRSRRSFQYEGSRRPSTAHASQRSRRSSGLQRTIVAEMTAHQMAKEKRRKLIVFTVIGTTLFLLLCCVLAVVVTLTHQSEFSLQNKTISYYTFSVHPKLVDDDTVEFKVRKENQELMNSLNRGHNAPHPNFSTPVPPKEK